MSENNFYNIEKALIPLLEDLNEDKVDVSGLISNNDGVSLIIKDQTRPSTGSFTILANKTTVDNKSPLSYEIHAIILAAEEFETNDHVSIHNHVMPQSLKDMLHHILMLAVANQKDTTLLTDQIKHVLKNQ